MSDWIDISVALKNGIVQWPQSGPMQLRQVQFMEKGAGSNVTNLMMDVHTGTHLDAPSHMLTETAAGVDAYPLQVLNGRAYVAYLPGLKVIDAEALDALSIPEQTRRLLIKTDNSAIWANDSETFHKDFTALSPGAARWIRDRNIGLVGIDYLSIEPFDGDHETHRTLMKAQVAILESIDLSLAEAGEYELLCLPLKLIDTDGAPCRAVLRPLKG